MWWTSGWLCYWGTIFVMTTSSAKRPANWQPGKQSENVYTHRFTARCFWFVFEYLFKHGWSTSELCGWLVFFFNLYVFLVTQQENTFEPHPFDWRCYLRNEGDINQRQHGDIYRREMCQYVVQSVVFFCWACISRWWFQICFILTTIWGRFPFWLIFCNWVENHQPDIVHRWISTGVCHFSDRDFLHVLRLILSKLLKAIIVDHHMILLEPCCILGNVLDIYIYIHILYYLVSNHHLLYTSLKPLYGSVFLCLQDFPGSLWWVRSSREAAGAP